MLGYKHADAFLDLLSSLLGNTHNSLCGQAHHWKKKTCRHWSSREAKERLKTGAEGARARSGAGAGFSGGARVGECVGAPVSTVPLTIRRTFVGVNHFDGSGHSRDDSVVNAISGSVAPSGIVSLPSRFCHVPYSIDTCKNLMSVTCQP